MKTKVLITGAGPTGLVLALWLARLGVSLRIIDKNAGPGLASRAMVVQARTLEFYRQLGFADELVKQGIKVRAVHLQEGSRQVATFKFGDFGEGLSPFPFVLSFPQDDHERLLVEQLKAAGLEVEWNTELVKFTDDGERVHVLLRKGEGEERCQVAYLCGCDGAHSAVRQGLGLGFPGGTYDQVFYVADVQVAGDIADGDLHLCLGEKDFCAVFPVRSSGMQRLIGIVPDQFKDPKTVTFEEIQPFAEKFLSVRIEKVNWFSTYQVHHRVAENFRRGRVFIAGDAGHIHSPAGGQGMNTGIGDAVNLSWKLAHVLQGRAAPSLLDTYEVERITFARSLVATTDRVFTSAVGQYRGAEIFRTLLIPHLLPFALGFTMVRRMAFRTVSQTRINYRESPISADAAGDIHGGDRLPWVDGPQGDNFEPLKALDWQIHIYGDAGEVLRDAVAQLKLPLHVYPWTKAAAGAGLERNALYLVRPDGYVALADPTQDVSRLALFLSAFKFAP